MRMFYRLLLFISFFLFPFILTAQEVEISKVLEKQVIYSQILGRDVHYEVYLPEGYTEDKEGWKILYLLHGLGGDEHAWNQEGYLKIHADSYFTEHPNEKRVIICPDGGRTWYFNDAAGKERYEDFFVQEFVPEVERIYRSSTDRNDRAVAGFSMGGFGSMNLTLHYPELFSACYDISGGIRTDEQINALSYPSYANRYAERFGVKEGENRISETYKKNSPIYVAKTFPEEKIETVRFMIDCGVDDDLLQGNYELFKIMRKRSFNIEFRIRDGGHTNEFSISALPLIFKFLSQE